MTDSPPDPLPPDEQALRAKRMRAYTELGLGLALRPRLAPTGASPGAESPDVIAAPVPEPVTRSVPELVPEPVTRPVTMLAAPRPSRPADALADLEQLAAEVADCQGCGLCTTRRQTVFAAGNPLAELAIVGEAPGAEEDRSGQAFVGNAGKLLDSMLASLGLNRQEHAYICNVIKCRPPDNRDPAPEEVASCEPFLQRQLGLVRPRVILVLGRHAAQALLRTEASIASLRGRIHAYEVEGRQVPVVVTYHPAYLLRNLGDKAKAWADLCLLESERQRIGSER